MTQLYLKRHQVESQTDQTQVDAWCCLTYHLFTTSECRVSRELGWLPYVNFPLERGECIDFVVVDYVSVQGPSAGAGYARRTIVPIKY